MNLKAFRLNRCALTEGAKWYSTVSSLGHLKREKQFQALFPSVQADLFSYGILRTYQCYSIAPYTVATKTLYLISFLEKSFLHIYFNNFLMAFAFTGHQNAKTARG